MGTVYRRGPLYQQQSAARRRRRHWVGTLRDGGPATQQLAVAPPDTTGYTTITFTAADCADRGAPSRFYVDLDDATDYRLIFEAPMQRPMEIMGGRNIVVKDGGHFRLDRTVWFSHGDMTTGLVLAEGASPTFGRIIYFEGVHWSGQMMKDGLRFGCPSAHIILGNCRLDTQGPRNTDSAAPGALLSSTGYRAFQGVGWEHADAIQEVGGCIDLTLDNVTIGGTLRHTNQSTPGIRGDYRLRRVNLRTRPGNQDHEPPHVEDKNWRVNGLVGDFEGGGADGFTATPGGSTLGFDTTTPITGGSSRTAEKTGTGFCGIGRTSSATDIDWSDGGDSNALSALVRLESGGGDFPMARIDICPFVALGDLGGSISTVDRGWVIGQSSKLTMGVAERITSEFPPEMLAHVRAARVILITDGIDTGPHKITVDDFAHGRGQTSVSFTGPKLTRHGIMMYANQHGSFPDGDTYCDNVWVEVHPDTGWQKVSDTAGNNFTVRYWDFDLETYVLDPPPGDATIEDAIIPIPSSEGTDGIGTYATWSNTASPKMLDATGFAPAKVYSGVPPGGDFCPLGVAGMDYVSAGYFPNLVLTGTATANATITGPLIPGAHITAVGSASASGTAMLRTSAPGLYEAEVMADSPSLYWKLGEAAGATTAQDETANDRDGTFAGGVTLDQSGALHASQDDGAVDFNGTDARITSTYNPWSGAVTLEAWVRPDNIAGAANDLIIGATSHTQFLIGNNGQVHFFFNGLNAISSTQFVADNQWSHVVATFTPNSGGEIFINGTPQGFQATALGYGASPGNMQVGAHGASPAGWFNGKIDEVAVYSGALSRARVEAHYLASKIVDLPHYDAVVQVDAPLRHWKLGEPSGTTAVDEMGVQNLTYANTPTLGAAGLLALNAANNGGDTAATFAAASSETAQGTGAPNLQASDVSVEAWVNFNSFPADGIVAALFNNASLLSVGAAFGIRVSSSGVIYPTGAPAAGAQIVTGRTYHAVVTLQASNAEAKMYLDGRLVGTATYHSAGGMAFAPDRVGIGSWSTFWNAYADATIDEVAIYGSVLSPERIAAHAAAGSGIVALAPATATATATLDLKAATTVSLAAASAQASASLALTAPTRIPLAAASATATGTLALTAPTRIPLAAASATATGTMALTAPTTVPLAASSATATGTLALKAPTTVPLAAASATATATLALTAPTTIPLAAASATATGTLDLSTGGTFPQIQDADTTTGGSTSNTTGIVTYPANISAGNLLVCLIVSTSTSNISFANDGWNSLVDGDFVTAAGAIGIGYKFAAGGESGTFSAGIGQARPCEWKCWRITGAHPSTPPEVAIATAVSTSPDPPSRDPAGWATEATLWMALYGYRAQVGVTGVTGTPANYTNHDGPFTHSTVIATIGAMRRELAAASEDPGAFTIAASTSNFGATLAIRPAPPAAAIEIPLAAASASAAGTLAVATPAPIALAPASATASASLALTAAAQVQLAAAAASATASLALTAPTTIPLAPATATATATANLIAPGATTVPLAAASATAAGVATLTAPTRVVLAAASATATGSLALTAPTRIVLAAASATATTSLALTAPTQVTLAPASASATASLAVTAPTQIQLAPAAATASGSATVTTPGQAIVPLAPASAGATGILALSAPTRVPLAPASATATGTLALTAPTRVILAAAAATATGTLALTAPTTIPLAAATATATASLDPSGADHDHVGGVVRSGGCDPRPHGAVDRGARCGQRHLLGIPCPEGCNPGCARRVDGDRDGQPDAPGPDDYPARARLGDRLGHGEHHGPRRREPGDPEQLRLGDRHDGADRSHSDHSRCCVGGGDRPARSDCTDDGRAGRGFGGRGRIARAHGGDHPSARRCPGQRNRRPWPSGSRLRSSWRPPPRSLRARSACERRLRWCWQLRLPRPPHRSR